MKTPLVALAITIASASSWAQEAQKMPSSVSIITATRGAEGDNGSSENSLSFGTEEQVLNSSQAVEMRRKLSDPAAREAVRTETVTEIKRQHPDLLEVLGLTPKEYEAFIETRADWQMDHLELFYALDPKLKGSQERFDRMQRNEQAMNAKLTELVGEQRFSRYQDYQRTVYARMTIVELNKLLAAKDAVAGERKEGLIRVMVEEQDRAMQSRMMAPDFPSGIDFSTLNDPKKRERFNFEMTVKSNERNLIAMEAESAALKERAGRILTPVQLARFAELEDKKINSQRKWVENMRRQLGPAS